MRLTKQTGHAIRILTDCAQAGGGLLKVAEISERLDITKQNVFKIVHILSRAGFVTAVRGPSGGVKLARAPASIRIGDVVRAIEVTDVEIDGETGVGARLAGEQASVNAVFDDALTAFIAVLDQHTLAELAALRRTSNDEAARNARPALKSKPPASNRSGKTQSPVQRRG